MAEITLSFSLEGEVSLPDYAHALKHLQALIDALCLFHNREAVASWDIAALQASSAQTTLRGSSLDHTFLHEVSRAFLEVGRTMERGDIPAYPYAIALPATRLTHLLNGRITAMRFETAGSRAVVEKRVPLPARPNRTLSFGSISGTIETLQRRRHRFTLYEEVFDEPVLCYLQDDQEEQMGQYWGKAVRVTGEIERAVNTQRAHAIPHIETIDLLPAVPSGSYERARGIIDFREHDPVKLLRSARDAE